MTAPDPPLRRARTVVLTVAGGLVLALISAYLVLGSYAARRVARTEEAWRVDFGSLAQIVERFPPGEANATALELERMCLALGIELAPRGVEDRPRPERDAVQAFKRVKREFSGYLDRQLARSEPGIEAPPETVRSFLQTHSETLEAVRRRLLDGDDPRWEMDVERLHAGPIPNLIGHADLQKVLILEALSRIADADAAAAQRSLEAGWRLNRSLLDRPILITQLVALSNARNMLGVLRLLERPRPAWGAYLSEHDFRQSFLAALKFEGWLWTRIRDTTRVRDVSTFLQRLSRNVAKPYVHFCFAELGDVYLERLRHLSEVEALCDRDLRKVEADLDLEVASWNTIGRLYTPQLGASLNRLARFELDHELTEKLLELRWARLDQRRWPATLPGLERSRACPRDHWIYTVAADGSMSIRLDREIEWRGLKGTRIPNRFSAAP